MERAITDSNTSVIEHAIKNAVQNATADRQLVSACFEAALGEGDRSGKLDPSKASQETVLRSAEFQRFRDDLFKDCYGDGSRLDQTSHERQHRLCTCLVDQLASSLTESDVVSFHLDPNAGRKRLVAASEAALAKCSAVSGR
jgi:hypothetical protein